MCGRSFTVLTLVLRGLMNPAISLVRNGVPLAVELISATHGSQATYASVRSRTALFVYPVCICGFYVLVPASHDVRAVSPLHLYQLSFSRLRRWQSTAVYSAFLLHRTIAPHQRYTLR